MTAKRPPGRPRNAADPHRAAADEAIARTVWQLLTWGYTLRGPGGVAEAVGQAALKVLKISDHVGLALGERTIEETFDRWLPTATRRTGWKTRPVMPVGRPWTTTSIDSLRELRPRGCTLEQTATKLLEHKGEWPDAIERLATQGDPMMTAKAYKEYLATKPNLVHDFGEKENGAENP